MFDDAAALGALRNTPDCDAAKLAHLSREQRETLRAHVRRHHRRQPKPVFLDPTLRAHFADELAQKGRTAAGPFHTCPPTSRRSLMGLSCWKGMDN